NVLVQLENLRSHPSVAAAIGRGELQVHGWLYKFETGQVFSFSPETNVFAQLERSAASPVDIYGQDEKPA
ncbi:MAG: carbonic anhydrase, partial [Planctomycetota bacterium]